MPEKWFPLLCDSIAKEKGVRIICRDAGRSLFIRTLFRYPLPEKLTIHSALIHISCIDSRKVWFGLVYVFTPDSPVGLAGTAVCSPRKHPAYPLHTNPV